MHLLVNCPSAFFPCNNMTLHFSGNSALLFFFFWPCCVACGISVPQPGIEPGPWRWNPRLLTTRPPGNSLCFPFSITPPSVSLLGTCINKETIDSGQEQIIFITLHTLYFTIWKLSVVFLFRSFIYGTNVNPFNNGFPVKQIVFTVASQPSTVSGTNTRKRISADSFCCHSEWFT